jgi:hypothetical protein
MSTAAGGTVPPLLALLLLLFGADVSTELPAVAAIDAGLLPLFALLAVIPIRVLRCAARCAIPSNCRCRALSVPERGCDG